MNVIYAIQQFASPFWDVVFELITDLGGQRAYIILLMGTYFAVDPQLGRRLGLFVPLGFYLNFHLKGLVGTDRPFLIDPSVARTPDADPNSGLGFPSGHAQLSLTFWGYSAWWVRRNWFWALAALTIALVSFSRIYLGMHFLVDIVGGLLIGALFVAVVAFAEPLWRSLRGTSVGLRVLLGVTLPLMMRLWLPPPGLEVSLILGALGAFASAPLLYPYHAPKALWRRVLIAVLAVALVFAALAASSVLLPEDVKRSALGGYVRYLVIGYLALVGTPLLATWTRLLPKQVAGVRRAQS